MTQAFQFGRRVRIKHGFQLDSASSAPPQLPTPPSPPPPPANPPPRLTVKDLPADSPDQSRGLFGPAGYMNTAARWYYPGTTQTVTDPSEKALMRTGQLGLGIGGAAVGALAAPAVASTAASTVGAVNTAGNTVMAGAGAGLLPHAQKAINTLQGMAPRIGSTAQSVQNNANKAINAVHQFRPPSLHASAAQAPNTSFASMQ